MDPTQNVWSTPTARTNHTTSTASQQQLNISVGHPPASVPADQLEDTISKLTQELETLKAHMKSIKHPTSESKVTKGKASSSKVKDPFSEVDSSKKASKKNPSMSCKKPLVSSSTKPPSHATPAKYSRAASAPPEFTNDKKSVKPRNSIEKNTVAVKASPKRHPQQMQSGDFPTAFTTTKTALFVHIKILWGLLKQDSVPKAPELITLQDFYRRFQSIKQIEQASRMNDEPNFHQTQVQCFKDVRAGRVRVGKSIIHLGDNFVRYAQGMLSRLGLPLWCPNLEEDPSSLYNAAHRIAAITTFQELAATSAYAYLNINPSLVMNLPLLMQAYNHFVHYLMLTKYKKELKEEGKNSKEAVHKKVSKARERLRNERRDFAVVNKFPKRHQDVLAQIAAHSDDEEVEGKGFYMIKTLPYRSKNVNRFFRRLDIVMKKAAEQDPLAKQSRRRIRRLPKDPVDSAYKVAPKGLPIDFYCPQWYHQLIPAQQQTIPNREKLAFLPNANQSLLPKAERHPDEKLADSTFTKKYWEVVAEPYGLVGGESSDEDEEEITGVANTDDEGEGIDLTQPSPDVSEDEFFAEGDAGELYEDNEFTVNSEDEDGNFEDEDAEDDDEYYENNEYVEYNQNAATLDRDHPMAQIEEEEEIW